MATTEDALAQVVSILAKQEAVWEQRLAAEKGGKEVPVTAFVTRQYVDHGVPGPEETKLDAQLAVHRYITQPATVFTEVGLTINIGNFESVRVRVGLTVPCYKEEVEDAYQWAKDFVEAKVKAEAAEVRAVSAQSKSNPAY